APVPKRAPREPAFVGFGLVLMAHDGRGDVPTLPAGLGRAVLQIDVLSVEAKARIEAADLVQHRATNEQEAAEHPVGLNGLRRRRLIEVEVLFLADFLAQRGAADNRPTDGREAAARWLPRAVWVGHLRAGDTAAFMRLHE